jgi:hypothetical protein
MSIKRTVNILEDLEQTVLQFMRKHKITHDEYRRATDILVRRHHPYELAARGLHKPYFEVDFDFILAPRAAEEVRRRA